MIFQAKYDSPLGTLTMASEGETLIGLWMETQTYFPSTVKEEMVPKEDLPLFSEVKRWLNRYFSGEKPSVEELPLSPRGSSFQREVWKILCEIPYGGWMTYGEIAERIALKRENKKMSPQAVGGAVGHNPISIMIPCHRVIGTKGQLTGYTGGLDKKIWLLSHEGFQIKNGTVLL
ncbi:MAG: methylated-DNA--[protein]-cysteine S-methyltransferase [Clostridia bacterium]